jgi:NADPH:quinone reductase-like Zn-dependent oxidoreductase
LKKGGRIVSMVEKSRQDLMKECGVEGSAQVTQVTTDRLNTLAALVDQGALKICIDETFSPERAAEALLHVEKGSLRGKVVLRMAASDRRAPATQ